MNKGKIKTILIVDDEKELRQMYQDAFESKGYKTILAENGNEMFEKLSMCSEIDIILLDIVMPEMDGFDALEKLRKDQRFRAMPVVMCTNLGEDDCQESLNIGANYCFRKTVGTPTELVKVVASYLSKK